MVLPRKILSDAGGGQNVGYIDFGDWMDYSVNVSSAGSYAINLRVASPSGGQLQIKDGSGSVLATVSIPNTGGYQSWQTVSANISLAAGVQTIRVQSTSNGWNFNWLEIATGGTTPPNPGVTTRIEAENYTNMSGVANENTSDAGGGQNVGYIDFGDWMDYSVNVSSAGSYAINLRVASPSGGQLQIKDGSGSVLATVSIPNTGGYQSWQTVSANISLAAGVQTIRVQSTSNGWNFNWLEIATGGTTPPNPGVTTRIEAENYTNMSGVAKENTSDAGGGQNVGYIDFGDWMDYSVNVSSAGSYAINLRVASPSGGQLQIKDGSGSVLATVSIPNTGGYQSWQTVSANISLAAGVQTIRVQSTSNGWNFNWLEIATGGTTPPNPGVTTRIEAENYTNMSGVAKENTSDAGGGQNVGYIDFGDWMDYSVNVSSAGSYAINLRVASPSGGQLQIKDGSGSVLATVSIPNTGGYQSWQTVSANISLAAGVQTIRVQSTSNGWNFNWLEIATGGAITSRTVTTSDVATSPVSSFLTTYPNPIVSNFQLQLNNGLKGTVSVQVYDMQGRLQKQFTFNKPNVGTQQMYLSIAELAAANYLVKVTMKGWTQTKQIIKH